MVLNADIEKMFKEIAASLKLGYQKEMNQGEEVYNFFYKDGFLVRFATFIDSREGKINIIVNFGSMTQRPISWGSYKKEELRNKAKGIIIAKLIELIEKK